MMTAALLRLLQMTTTDDGFAAVQMRALPVKRRRQYEVAAMPRATVVSLVLVGLLAALSPAAPVINVGTWYLLPGMEREFTILVSSSADLVEGLDLAIQIGSGGPLNGGTDTWPKITRLWVVGPGLVFDQNVQDYVVGPLYDEILDVIDPLIWRARVRMSRGHQVLASGTLAKVTLKADGTGELERAVRLTGVAAGYDPPGLDTNFGLEPFPTVINGLVRVWQPHPLTWISPANGNWTDTDAWNSGPYPAHYPNCTAMAVLDTPRTIGVQGFQEAYSLTVGAGEVSVGPGARLNLLSASAIGTQGKLTVAGMLDSQGTLTSHGLLEIAAGATVNLPELLGAGTTTVAAGATLTAESIYQTTLSVDGLPGSPGRVVFRSSAGAPQAGLGVLQAFGGADLGPALANGGAAAAAPVAEPCTLVVGLTAAIGLWTARGLRRLRRRPVCQP